MKKNLIILILSLTGTWFLKLWWFNQLALYIIPRYNGLVIATGIFCLMSAFLLFWKDAWHWHETKFHTDWKPLFILIFPIFLGFALKPAILSIATANQRGNDTSLENFSSNVDPIVFETKSEDRNFEDWINILGQSPNPQQYIGDTVFISGFLSGTVDAPLLSRFLLRCCAADARAVSFRIKKLPAEKFSPNQWIEISGNIQSDQNESQPLFIQVKTSKSISNPDNPYLN